MPNQLNIMDPILPLAYNYIDPSLPNDIWIISNPLLFSNIQALEYIL